MAAKRGLGKGLDGIIEDKKLAVNMPQVQMESAVKSLATLVDITKIDRNKEQPRKRFDEEELEELADSIKQHGLLQPIVVQDRKSFYEIIAGERRWRACMKAGIKEVPVIIKDLDEQEIVELSLIENIQRKDLDALEEAMAYKKLKTDFNLTDDQIAAKVSKSRAAVTNSMRLLKLSIKVQEMIIDEMISTGHARALLAISDEDKQYDIAQKIFDEKLSVREAEKLVKNYDKPQNVQKKKANDNLDKYKAQFDEYKDKITKKLGTKCNIVLKDKNEGKIEIDFYNLEDFERIYDILSR